MKIIKSIFWRTIGFFENLPYMFKMFFQKVFRKDHVSNNQIWDCCSYLARYIYPRIKRFYEGKRVGYPSAFIEYDEGGGTGFKNKQKYDQAKKDGWIEGGGPEAWEEVLKEIFFAFEFMKAEEDNKFFKKVFAPKYGDWHEKKEENLCKSRWFKEKDGNMTMTCGEQDNVDLDKWEPRDPPDWDREPFYYDIELHKEFIYRAQKGLELFGKYFNNLWD